ncbi:MAG: Mu transposase C-terminal domain-containing protein, partial [Lachnospiraceae bacterium]
AEQERPWYVNADIDWFMENRKTEWYKAIEIGNVVREFLQYSEKGKAEYADSFAQERLGKNKRTLYRYVKAYQEASAWAYQLHKQDGADYDYLKILALCRKPKETGTFPSFTPEVKQAIKNIWFNKEFAMNQGTRELLYDKLQLLARINHWEKIPSYQSVVRYISYLMEDEGMKNAWYLASHGVREYKNKVMGKALMDTTVLKPMEIVMGDEHTFDCWVAYTHPNGKVTPIKPVLVAWIDVRSRRIIGDVICHHANSDILKESLIKLINTPGCGVPEWLLIDNGKDYTAEMMTGVPRNQRDIDGTDYIDLANGFYRKLGIEHIHRALPYQPWTKGQIERFFGGVCSRFSKQFTSYTGTLTGSRTDAKIPKDIQKMCDRGELLTMEEFYEQWQTWLVEKYEKRVHRGLKDAGEKYKTPLSLFENEEHYYKPAPPKSAQIVLMYREDNVRIRNYGFKRYGKVYDHPALRTHINESLSIRYDKHDISTIFVIGKDGRTICEAECQELLAFGTHVSEEALVKHMKKQNRQLREDRRILEENNVPFEEMNDQYIGFSSVTGGIDLMIGKKPKKKDNLVSMPLDKDYRNGFRGKAQEPEPVEENEYINKKAEDALKSLRAL